MRLFYFLRDVEIPFTQLRYSSHHKDAFQQTRQEKILFKAYPEPFDVQHVKLDRVYLTADDHLKKIGSYLKRKYKQEPSAIICSPDKLQGSESIILPDLPLHIGYHDTQPEWIPLDRRIAPLLGRKILRLAIVNGFGIGIGDNLIGLAAFRVLYQQLLKSFQHVEVDCLQLSVKQNGLLFDRENNIRNVYQLPMDCATFIGYDAYIDCSDMVKQESFNRMPMVDFYLTCFRVDPETVSSRLKKPGLPSINVTKPLGLILQELKKDGPLLLFHPKASSSLRSIPDSYITPMIDLLINHTGYTLISVCPIRFKHSRFVNLSSYSKQLEDYISIISKMDAVISVDSSAPHIAAASDIPALVISVSINPDYRFRYYPKTKSYFLGNNSPVYGKHMSRGHKEARIAETLWKRLNPLDILKLLPGLSEVSAPKYVHPTPISPEHPVVRNYLNMQTMYREQSNTRGEIQQLLDADSCASTNSGSKVKILIPDFGNDQELKSSVEQLLAYHSIHSNQVNIIDNVQYQHPISTLFNQGCLIALTEHMDFVWLLDPLCIPSENFLNDALSYFKENPECALIAGSSDSKQGRALDEVILCVIIKSSTLRNIGFFDPAFKISYFLKDYAYRTRLVNLKIHHIPLPSFDRDINELNRRYHPGVIRGLLLSDQENFRLKWSLITGAPADDINDRLIDAFIMAPRNSSTHSIKNPLLLSGLSC